MKVSPICKMFENENINTDLAALFFSLAAIIIALLKEFILPWFYKPKLEFKYEESPPYRRANVQQISRLPNQQTTYGTYLRFSAKNYGSRPAINCRCQVSRIEKDTKPFGDYEGYPLRWANRPESIISQASGERLNLGIKEKEFLDLACTMNSNKYIILQKYHDVPIGISDTIDPGTYDIYLVFSGDNFQPYFLHFKIWKEDSNDPNTVTLELIKSHQ